MKTPIQFAVLCLCLLAFHASAATYYVDINSPNPTPPYTSWNTAATNIQDAIAETVNGDSVLVNPGVYHPVVVTNAISIQGVSGPTSTTIDGNNAMRCIYLVNGAMLTGFTLKNGLANDGGGVYCASTAGTIVSNCVITANIGENQGGGAYQGTYWNCSVSQNFGPQYGAGAYDAVLINCMIISNSLFGNDAEGAGVYNSDVTNSVIADNSAPATAFGSAGGGAYMGNLDHCNIIGNSSEDGGGTYNANLVNCINYFNICNTNGGNPYSSNYDGGTINYSCTAGPEYPGSKDITTDPQLASFSHISLGSPCRGAGIAAAPNGVDIDGNPWATPPSMGCFEPYPGEETGVVTVAVSAPFTNWAPGWALNLQANISGPVYSNVWNFGDGTFVTNEADVSHTWSATGTYPVTLTAYNDSYPTGVTATLPITITVPSVYYVNLNNLNPVPPYITWATAAVNIQDAVSVAASGSTVLVTNGPTGLYSDGYFLTNTAAFYVNGGATAPDGKFYRVVITNAITLQSVSGPASTYIWGIDPNGGLADCVYMINGAILSGFTATNDQAGGSYGQITAASTNALITNCVMTHYVAINSGTLNNCSLALNSSAANGALNNCLFIGSDSANSTLNSCIVSNDSQVVGGVLNNCIIVNNTNSSYGNSPAMAEQGYPLVLNNCLISNNVTQNGGAVYNEFTSTPTYYTNCVLNNCTLTRNSGQSEAGAWGAELNNC
ncbi:MAG: PKD domain-containing protein, partial [Limisphaerales bacterium]